MVYVIKVLTSEVLINCFPGAALLSQEAVNRHPDESKQRTSNVIHSRNNYSKSFGTQPPSHRSSTENQQPSSSVYHSSTNWDSSRKRRKTVSHYHMNKSTRHRFHESNYSKRVDTNYKHRHDRFKVHKYSSYQDRYTDTHCDQRFKYDKKSHHLHYGKNINHKHNKSNSEENDLPIGHYTPKKKKTYNSISLKTRQTSSSHIIYTTTPEITTKLPPVLSEKKDYNKGFEKLLESNSHSPVSVSYLSSSDNDQKVRMQLLKENNTVSSKNRSANAKGNSHSSKLGGLKSSCSRKLNIDENVSIEGTKSFKQSRNKTKKQRYSEKSTRNIDHRYPKSHDTQISSYSKEAKKKYSHNDSPSKLHSSRSNRTSSFNKNESKCNEKLSQQHIISSRSGSSSSSSSSSGSSSESSANSQTRSGSANKRSRWNSGSSESSSCYGNQKNSQNSEPLGPPLADQEILEKIKVPTVESMIRQRNCKYCALYLKTKADVTRHIMTQRHKIVTGEFFIDRDYLIGVPYKGDIVHCTICNAALSSGDSVNKHEESNDHLRQLHRWISRGQPHPLIKFYIDPL